MLWHTTATTEQIKETLKSHTWWKHTKREKKNKKRTHQNQAVKWVSKSDSDEISNSVRLICTNCSSSPVRTILRQNQNHSSSLQDPEPSRAVGSWLRVTESCLPWCRSCGTTTSTDSNLEWTTRSLCRWTAHRTLNKHPHRTLNRSVILENVIQYSYWLPVQKFYHVTSWY